MRRERFGLVLAAALLWGTAMNGCSTGPSAGTGSGGSSSRSGGTTGSGGSNATGAGGSTGGSTGAGGSATGAGGSGTCTDVTACGGNLVGTWTVSSSCLALSGELDLSLLGAGCPSAPVTGTLQVTGTWTANADGTYADGTTTVGTEQLTLGASCLVISSTPVTCSGAANVISSLGYDSITCTDAAGGGCNCTATIKQSGGIGVVSPAPSTDGNYTTAASTATLTGDSGDTSYAYCVSGGKLTMSPQSMDVTTTGTIVLQQGAGGSTGSGGSGGSVTGTGGSGSETTGSGGSGGSVTGTGGGGSGTTGSGGATGSGGSGTTGSGGSATGSGGRGGTTGSGGAASSGGATGSGGNGTTGSGGSGTGAGGSSTGGATGAGGSAAAMGPCDIYKSGGTPCVAAHSTVRALLGAYAGKLYQVRNAAGTTMDISAMTAGGVADSAAQDTFCAGTTCVITIIYDQSGKGNDLQFQGSGSVPGGQDKAASATGESIHVGGNKVYSLYINPGNSYWVNGANSGIPLGSAPEAMYMVTSGKHYNSGCCFDYGNSESDRKADGAGAMDAINFSDTTAWGTGAGSGPWVMADLEYGLFAEGSSAKNQSDPSQTATFVTAVLKNNGTTEFTLRGADATTGDLTTYYKGALPAGWSPMKKQGAMVLGSGGDCCATNTNLSDGTFYEGCLVSGYPSDATEAAVQANIVAAGYTK